MSRDSAQRSFSTTGVWPGEDPREGTSAVFEDLAAGYPAIAHTGVPAQGGTRWAVDGIGAAVRLLDALLAQMIYQGGHLLAGGTVDALDRGVAGLGIATGGDEGIAALAVVRPQGLVFTAQAVYLALQAGVIPGLPRKLAEDILHLAFLGLELTPVPGQILAVLAA